MPIYREQRHIPFSRSQVFGLVAGIEDYPSFIRWCPASRVRTLEESSGALMADVIVRARMVHERLTARVELVPNERIALEHVAGPFKRMRSLWRFSDAKDGGCVVDVEVDFELRSSWLQRIVDVFFDEAVRRLVNAFEARARTLYGTSPQLGAGDALPAPA